MKKNLLGISLITITCLYGLLAALIILIFILTDLPVLFGILLSIIILIIQFLISPFLTDLSMRWFYGATFNDELPENIKKFISETCQKYNMKYPKIGYIDDGAPNAFTYGRTKNDARIIVTRGILELLNEEEAKSVIAHELGHATHYDMLFMTVAQLVPLLLYGISQILIESNSSDNDNNSLAAVGAVAYIMYLISEYIVLWLSRTREYYADAFAIEETKNPNALAEALVKIGYGLSTSETKTGKGKKVSASKSNSLGIFESKSSKSLVVSSYGENGVSKDNIQNAMKWEMWNVWAKINELNSTHPLISKRLIAISSRSKEFNQEPYIEFNQEKPESYVDDFIGEVIIFFLPIISIVATMIIGIVLLGYESEYTLLVVGLGGLISTIFSLLKYSIAHKNKKYTVTNIASILGIVKVSHITSFPCKLQGKLIGKGDPGCIFNEDFVLQDNTGIIFLDYNQPIPLFNTLFAIFKSKDYIDKEVRIKGWYRRSSVPYVEIKEIEIDGKIKKCYTYTFGMIWRIISAILCALIILSSII